MTAEKIRQRILPGQGMSKGARKRRRVREAAAEEATKSAQKKTTQKKTAKTKTAQKKTVQKKTLQKQVAQKNIAQKESSGFSFGGDQSTGCDDESAFSFSSNDHVLLPFGATNAVENRTPLAGIPYQSLVLPTTLGQTSYFTKTIAPFGQPEEPVPGFTRPLWVRQEPQAISNWLSRSEKSLEDLYNEHPEKRLRSIEPDTLDLVAQTIQQVASEAANDWLKTACPNTRWKDRTIRVDSLYDFSAPQLDYTILNRAANLQKLKSNVAMLLRNSRATYGNAADNLTPLALVHMIDHCISICQVIKDKKRKAILEKFKEKIEWLPVGLDCKKLDIQRRAAKELDQHQQWTEKELASVRREAKDKCRHEGEMEILDRALVEFQEYRLEFVIEIFRTLDQLLKATS
ncbi:hypothetical protein BJ170DRAFT_730648 [Xylariales sp. AK1849]|nr:hypothetical protein BJ170DRAFT_730648 [Xylariales sp. AK1849]